MLGIYQNSTQYLRLKSRLLDLLPAEHPLAAAQLLTPGYVLQGVLSTGLGSGNVVATFQSDSFTVEDSTYFVWRIAADALTLPDSLDVFSAVYIAIDFIQVDGNNRFAVYNSSCFIYRSAEVIYAPEQVLNISPLIISAILTGGVLKGSNTLQIPALSVSPSIAIGQLTLAGRLTPPVLTITPELAAGVLSGVGVLSPSALQVEPVISNAQLSVAGVLTGAALEIIPNISQPNLSLVNVLDPAGLVLSPEILQPGLSLANVLDPAGLVLEPTLVNPALSLDQVLTAPTLSVSPAISQPELILDTPSSSAATLSTLAADEIPVLIASGQSNQGTYTDGSQQNTGPMTGEQIASPNLTNVFVYNNVTDSFDPIFNNTDQIDGYAMASVAEDFRAEFPTKPLYLIWHSIGGTGFEDRGGQWAPGGTVRTSLIENYVKPGLQRMLSDGLKPFPAFWFWQGEQDASAPSSSPNWAYAWKEAFLGPTPNHYSLIEELRQISPGIGAVVMQLSTNTTFTYRDQVRSEQLAAATQDDNIELVDATPGALQGDGIHFSAAGFATLAPSIYSAWKLLGLTEVSAVGVNTSPLSFGNSASAAAGVLDGYPDPLIALSVRKLKSTSPIPAIALDRSVTDYDASGALPVGTTAARVDSVDNMSFRSIESDGWSIQTIDGVPGWHYDYVESIANANNAWLVSTDLLNTPETDFLVVLLATWEPLTDHNSNIAHSFGNTGPYGILEFRGLNIGGLRLNVRGSNENQNGFATLDSSTFRLSAGSPPEWRLLTVQRSGLSFTCHANGNPIGNTYTAGSAFAPIGDVAFRFAQDMPLNTVIAFAGLWVGANVPSDPRQVEAQIAHSFGLPGLTPITPTPPALVLTPPALIINPELSAPAEFGAWSFNSLTPTLWLKGTTNVNTISSNVSTWEDFRSNGIFARQTSAALRPGLTSLNSLQAIDMGLGKELSLDAEINVRSLFVVIDDVRQSDNSDSVSSLFQENSSTLPAQGAFVRVNRTDYTLNISNVGGVTNTGAAALNGGPLTAAQPADGFVLLNGEQPVDGSGPYIFYIEYNADQRIGRFGDIDSGSTQRRGNNHIAEYVFFDSPLSAADIDKGFGKLAHDWGLTNLLPSNHPYKTDRP